ncbi:MAG: T9SS type A sorting domain-containing protein [Chitinophagales bacterium]
MKYCKNLLLSFLIFLLHFHTIIAQPESISGIINTYASVISIDTAGCGDVIAVSDAGGFATGDTVMLIQMKGATIDSSNTSSFGDVTDFGNAGNYEFSSVTNISVNQITLAGKLQNLYLPSGYLQIIRVPSYSDAVVTSSLFPQDWNGITGGVLVFFVSDTLSLNADIDASGKGFLGGIISNNPDGACGNNNIDGYYYDLYQGGSTWTKGGAQKGEGIYVLSSTREAGRGKQANGGGGGNKHNTGGGGGGNYTNGGKGGNELESCIVNENGGIGGAAMPYNLGKIFIGGGGGCGDFNNGVGSGGANGGGIIIIKAKYVVGNGRQIIADGFDELIMGGGIGDGVGGGGGGGTVLLDVQDFTLSSLTLQANGGDGGYQGTGNTWGCAGTGGGGGTGVIYISGSSLPVNVTTNTLPGAAGIILNPLAYCYNTTYGAEAGDSSATSYLTGLSFSYSLPLLLSVTLGNDTSICEGDTFQLDAGNTGADFLWSTGDTTQSIPVSASGEYSVMVSNATCSTADTITLSHIPCNTLLFTASDTSVCEKFCIGFFDSSQNNPVSWQWLFEGGNPSSSTLQNPEDICYNLSGSYDVTLISTGVNNVTDTLLLMDYIVVYPTPSIPVISQNGYVLTSSPSPFYQWQYNSIDIPGATNQSYTVTQSGLYTVVVSSEAGCRSSANFYFLISGLDYPETIGLIDVYPNPSNGIFNVELSNLPADGFASINIINTLGRTVYYSEKLSSPNLKHEINLKGVFPGIYFLEVKIDNTHDFPEINWKKKKIVITGSLH